MEQRRTQRYKLQLPLQILQVGEQRVNRIEQTRDISSGGVCFISENHVDVGGRIEYVITLSGAHPPVRIRCLGKVLRAAKRDQQRDFEVAITMERYQFIRAHELENAAATA